MLELKKNVSMLCMICLTIGGCDGFPEMPEGKMYQLDTMEGRAYEYEIPKTIGGEFKYTGKDMYLIQLDNYVCFSPTYKARVNAWLRDVHKYAEDKCSD